MIVIFLHSTSMLKTQHSLVITISSCQKISSLSWKVLLHLNQTQHQFTHKSNIKVMFFTKKTLIFYNSIINN